MLSLGIALVALTVAIIIAIKMPKNAWFKRPAKQAASQAEILEDWAPEYTLQEKLKQMAWHVSWLLPLYLATQYAFSHIAEKNAYCIQFMGISTFSWLLIGMLMLLTLLVLGSTSYLWFYWHKVHRCEQFPLPQQKVWKPQKIIKGELAKRRATLYQWCLALLGMAFLISMLVLLFLLMDLLAPEAIAAKCGKIAEL